MLPSRPFSLGLWSLGILLGASSAEYGNLIGHETGLILACVAGASLTGLAWICPETNHARCVAKLWRIVSLALACVGGFGLSFGSAQLRALDRLEHRLVVTSPAIDTVLTVEIDEMPVVRPDGVRLRVRPVIGTDLNGPRADLRIRRLQIVWYGTPERPVPSDLQAGQQWRLPLRLKPPHGTLNPSGFDVEQWLFQQDIGATGSVRAQAAGGPLLLREAQGRVVERWRQSVRDRLAAHLGPGAVSGVLAALAVGDQASIDREDWAVFRRTGVAHLMAISGVHVTMFAWLAAAAASRLWRLSARGLFVMPAGAVGRWCGVLAASVYAVLAGWGVPAQRTVWMLMIWALTAQCGGRWSWHRVLSAAAAAIGLLDPWALAEPGFWLSFVAVALLMVDDAGRAPKLVVNPLDTDGSQGPLRAVRARVIGRVVESVRVQARITAGLAPLTLVLFRQISWVGLVANLLAIPWVTLLVTPLALLGVVWPGFWTLGGLAVEGLMWVLERAAAVPAAVWQSPLAPVWAKVFGLWGGVLVVLPIPRGWRVLGVPMIIALMLPPRQGPAAGHFDLWSFDVGQGTAVLVRTQSHALLFDTGPKYWREGDAGERIVAPQLHALGATALDVMLLSHRDSDHVGGAASLLKEIRVGKILSTLEPGHPLRAGGAHQACTAGLAWNWDGVRFEVLRPLAASLEAAHASPRNQWVPLTPRAGGHSNALSCVLAISNSQQRALLTGDIEAAQEQALLADVAVSLRSDVLMVPHHGSKTSSTLDFVAAVRPRFAFIQAGFLNRFGHPVAAVEARYLDIGAQVIRSDRCGAWHWNSADGIGQCERDQRQSIWRLQ